jgi:hypothetical protein
VRPGLGEAQARSRCLDIHAHAIFEDGDLVGYDVPGRSQGRRAEPGVEQRIEQSLGVVGRGFDQDIQVEGHAGHAVQDRGDPADHDVFHVMAVKGPEYALESI